MKSICKKRNNSEVTERSVEKSENERNQSKQNLDDDQDDESQRLEKVN